MRSTARQPSQRPIGALAALVTGFDRIAARPSLLLPPLLVDIFLWLGPHLRLQDLVRALAEEVALPPGTDPSMAESLQAFRQGLITLGENFNVFSALSSLPMGIPSLMAARMPVGTPMGPVGMIDLREPLPAVIIMAGLTVLGLGLGGLYQVVVARQVAPKAELASPWVVWLRFGAFAALVYIAVLVVTMATLLVATLVSVLLPLIGVAVAFLALSLMFWTGIYLYFTPHGIVRYRFGVLKAIVESVILVRWNLLGTVGFLALAFGASWLTNQVWVMPEDTSWLSLLAVVGHAFVSATLLAGSYAFYQGRREWLLAMRQMAGTAPGGDVPPPQTPT